MIALGESVKAAFIAVRIEEALEAILTDESVYISVYDEIYRLLAYTSNQGQGIIVQAGYDTYVTIFESFEGAGKFLVELEQALARRQKFLIGANQCSFRVVAHAMPFQNRENPLISQGSAAVLALLEVVESNQFAMTSEFHELAIREIALPNVRKIGRADISPQLKQVSMLAIHGGSLRRRKATRTSLVVEEPASGRLKRVQAMSLLWIYRILILASAATLGFVLANLR